MTPHASRRLLLTAAGTVLLLVVVLVGLVASSRPQPATPTDAPAIRKVEHREAAPPYQPPRAGPTERMRTEPVARGPAEEALFALIAESGHGFVRCRLPEQAGDVDLRRLPMASQMGDVLTLAVDGLQGTIPLHRNAGPEPIHGPDEDHSQYRRAWLHWLQSQQPEAFAVWRRQTGAVEGICMVRTDDDRVPVEVLVTWPDHTPVHGVYVTSDGSSSETDERGRAEVQVFRDGTGEVVASFVDERTRQDLPGVVRDGLPIISHVGRARLGHAAAEPVHIVLEPNPETDVVLSAEEYAVQGEIALEDFDTWAAQVHTQALSKVAREQLAAWRDALVDDIDGRYDTVDGLLELEALPNANEEGR